MVEIIILVYNILTLYLGFSLLNIYECLLGNTFQNGNTEMLVFPV
jgi:hypothetical protein